MNSFEKLYIERLPITHNILRTIRLLGEFKGKQELFTRQTPQLLETLRQAAIIQSTESSNRIEGVTAPLERIKALVAEKTTPRNRSEQEILGYRDVLNKIHTSFADIPVTANVVLQFHRDLYSYTEGEGGKWKTVDNQIIEKFPDGTEFIRFKTVSAFATADAMERLHRAFNASRNSGEFESLLLIPAYVLDFLCIHPFLDGNGRMSRLLTLLLLYQAGYEVGRYISLEKLVEKTKESYYEALNISSRGWHEGKHDLTPWMEYFLGLLIAAYREFEERVGILTTARGAKTQMILEAVRHLPETFRITDVERACPQVKRDLIRKVLNRLRTDGKLEQEGRGLGAVWRRSGTEFSASELINEAKP
ncbi:MAG: Fic family protein [Blastocatellia bacterium]